MTLREKVERALVEFGVYHDDAGFMASVVEDAVLGYLGYLLANSTDLQVAYNVIKRFLDMQGIELDVSGVPSLKRSLSDGRIERLYLDEAYREYRNAVLECVEQMHDAEADI